MTLKIASLDLRQLPRAGRSQDDEAANSSLHKLGMDYLYGALHVTAIRVSPGASPAQHDPRHQDPAVFVELVTEEVEE